MEQFSNQEKIDGTQMALRVLIASLQETHSDALRIGKEAIQKIEQQAPDRPYLRFAIGMFPDPLPKPSIWKSLVDAILLGGAAQQ